MTPSHSFPRKPEPLPEARPVAYVVLRSAQICRHCQTMHETSQVMLRCEMTSRHAMGSKVIQMKALQNAPEWKLPIEYRIAETKSIPFCHECFQDAHTAVSHLPVPPAADTRTLRPDGSKYGLDRAAAAIHEKPHSPTGSSPTKARKPAPSTDDLLSFLD